MKIGQIFNWSQHNHGGAPPLPYLGPDCRGLGIRIIYDAKVPEREGLQVLLSRVLCRFTWLRLIRVDNGYTGSDFAQWVRELRPTLEVEVVKRSDDAKGFRVLPSRWVMERTFGWLLRRRRLVRDDEHWETSAESWVYIAMIRNQLRRLA